MPIIIEEKCKDYGREGCLEVPDERFTMNFDDIGEDPIKFCAACGPEAHLIHSILMEQLRTRGPEFAIKLDQALTHVEQEEALSRS